MTLAPGLLTFVLLGWMGVACVGEEPSSGGAAASSSGSDQGGGSGGSGGGGGSGGSGGGGSGSSSGGNGSGGSGSSGAIIDDAALKPTDVHVVRNPDAEGHPSYGTRVKLVGLVVMGVKYAGATHGFFVQDRDNFSWGGIYVYTAESSADVAIGDLVDLVGVYSKYRGFEQLTEVTVARTGKVTPPPALLLTVDDLREGSSRALEFQSVYVTVHDVVAVRATAGVDFAVKPRTGSTNELIVTSYIANDTGASPFPATAGWSYSAIRGFGYKSGSTDASAASKLAPLGPGALNQ